MLRWLGTKPLDSKGVSVPLTRKEFCYVCQVWSSDRNESDDIGGVTLPQSIHLKTSTVLAPLAGSEFSSSVLSEAFTIGAGRKPSKLVKAANDMVSHAVCYKLSAAALRSECASYAILEGLQIPKP